ncbi:Dihydrodipicolinate synthase/N-acetylneuraminate lyase [Geosmithia morbida]|uniref:Dihydrodipicolinate synthase/N-acetylneuraminate lyase n=1 Tax=Geosmithia morbida TaxID=1094350 RepID=A0A9P4YS92_9HYPO|nr:Dihydrodipicolinate synthase/N-acetylneuraminate lyase [Geosmithia morbida]KAF4120849.1 Dihydrodipicolinate synthase/N-acetylneuraminate lyase [Geosmithia morbida]
MVTNNAGRRALPCGIYAPTMTFFDPETEDIDIPTIKKHAQRLVQSGLVGLVTLGSNGEAVHCTREEKIAVTKATREALDEAGFASTPIIFGGTEGSVRGTIELSRLAFDAGADYNMLLPPSYYKPQMDAESVYDYFVAVADKSPLPVIIYNYPGAVSGTDLDSDTLLKLAEHPNIVGTKFTCGNTGKLTRVALGTDAKTPSSQGSGYMAFGGMCDFTVQTLASGGSGIIAGGANVLPKLCTRVWDLWVQGKTDEAIALQKVLSRGDWPLTKAAIAGTKQAIQTYYGYGGYPRQPLKRLDAAQVTAIQDGTRDAIELRCRLTLIHPSRSQLLSSLLIQLTSPGVEAFVDETTIWLLSPTLSDTMSEPSSGSSSAPTDVEDASASNASERTPLLSSTKAAPIDAHQNGSPSSVSATATAANDEERTVLSEELSFTRIALIMGTSWVGVFLGATDSTIIATLSAPISSEFKSLSLLSWLATAYLISNAACQPISGRLTDIFGRGPGLVVSNILFALGNLICGIARDEYVMILGRVVAGIGGGGLMSISTFLGSDLIPLRQRGVIQGVGNVCYGSGAMLGGIFGGLLNDHAKMGWRLAFLIQVPPVLLSAIFAAILIRVPPKQSDKSFIARIDFGGVFLTVSFLVLLLLGLNSGGNLVPWTHPLPLTTIPLAVVTLVAFVVWESRARQPIIPVKLIVTRTILSACACNLLCTMVVMTALFYVPLYLQVLGDTATTAGLRILPSPVGVSIGSVGAGYIMKRTGRYFWLGVSSLVLFTVGVVLFTMQTEATPSWLTSLAFLFVGGGYGSTLTMTLLACIASVDHSQQAVVTSATCMFSTALFLSRQIILIIESANTNTTPDLARSLGGTVGITIGSAIYQNLLKARLWERFGHLPGAAEKIQRIRDDLDELKHLPEGWHDGVVASFMEAFKGVWVFLLALSVGALFSISMIRQHTLHTTLDRRSNE